MIERPRTFFQTLIICSFGLIALGSGTSAHGQYVTPTPRAYRPAPQQFVKQAPQASARRGLFARPALPYNRSPYTDDWSTARHLPFPKPWMLPTRDPAARGR